MQLLCSEVTGQRAERITARLWKLLVYQLVFLGGIFFTVIHHFVHQWCAQTFWKAGVKRGHWVPRFQGHFRHLSIIYLGTKVCGLDPDFVHFGSQEGTFTPFLYPRRALQLSLLLPSGQFCVCLANWGHFSLCCLKIGLWGGETALALGTPRSVTPAVCQSFSLLDWTHSQSKLTNIVNKHQSGACLQKYLLYLRHRQTNKLQIKFGSSEENFEKYQCFTRSFISRGSFFKLRDRETIWTSQSAKTKTL